MGRHGRRADRDDDADEDWDEESEDGAWEGDDDSDDETTVPCPYCHRDVLEDSPWCPSCDRYITEEDFRRAGRPTWVVVTALVCLAVAVWWVFAAI